MKCGEICNFPVFAVTGAQLRLVTEMWINGYCGLRFLDARRSRRATLDNQKNTTRIEEFTIPETSPKWARVVVDIRKRVKVEW